MLIGCGADKAPSRCAAIDLYTGPVFAAHRRILAALGYAPDYILSAEHELLDPHEEVDPYETTSPGHDWHDQVALQLLAWREHHVGKSDHIQPVVLVLAGPDYVDGWRTRLGADFIVDDPLRGLMVGERRQFAADLAVHGPMPIDRYTRPSNRKYLLVRAKAFVEEAVAKRPSRRRM